MPSMATKSRRSIANSGKIVADDRLGGKRRAEQRFIATGSRRKQQADRHPGLTGAAGNGDAAPVEEITERGVAQRLVIRREEQLIVLLQRFNRRSDMGNGGKGDQAVADETLDIGDEAAARFENSEVIGQRRFCFQAECA